MAILFDWYENPKPSDKEQGEKTLHPRLKYNGSIGTDVLSRRIQERCSLTETDSVVIYVSNNYRRGNVDSRRKNEAKDVYAIYTIFVGVISVLCYWWWNYIKNFITVTVVSV